MLGGHVERFLRRQIVEALMVMKFDSRTGASKVMVWVPRFDVSIIHNKLYQSSVDIIIMML